mmetsp:Transcript_667/g.1050  ORF Transcript_667/g.1050 Transcript_667/m.1050 type:complete len:427 (+) Transcript_667:66-1346(+)
MRFLQAAAILQSTASLLRLPPIAQAFVLSSPKIQGVHYYLLQTSSIAISRPPQKQLVGITTSTSSIATTATTTLLQATSAPKSYFSSLTDFSPMPDLTYPLLTAQNATTTNAIINHYAQSESFTTLSTFEGNAILQRDAEDDTKLQKGIDIAKAKGVIDPKFIPEEYIAIDVLGKNPEEVAEEILTTVRSSSSSGNKGGVVVICGLSGTGKGTTVSTLQQKLESDEGKQVVCWSNGNIFRSVTLLAATWCEQQQQHADESNGGGGGDGDITKALTKENLAEFMTMLSFGKFKDGKYDTRICGLGLDCLVSEVQNTELKGPKVSKNIPTVAEVTQGEVILFAAEAIRQMGEDGIFVLLEGREQTVNYVRTPLRFTLTLSDLSLIGKRRAAQRLAAGVLDEVKEGASVEEIEVALDGQLAKMVKEASA